MRGWSLAHRDAERAAHAKVAEIRKEGVRLKEIGVRLGLSTGRVYSLLTLPPLSEEARDALLESERVARQERQRRAAEWRARDAAMQKREREEFRRRGHEEAHETNAQAFVCLIEALIEMRPFLPKRDGDEAPA